MASRDFNIELWTEYGIGVCAFALRFYAKWKTTKFTALAWDDLFCVLGLILFTLDAGLTYTYGRMGSAVGLTTETAAALPPKMVHDFTVGERCLFFAWICYICLTWSLKAVMLSLYSRLTVGLWQQKLVKFMAVFCFLSWSTCIIAHFAVCVPVSRALQVVPYPGDACVLRKLNHALVGALNILCDIGIMAIPIPILFAARIDPLHKAILSVLFTSAIFVIITVILRVRYSLGDIGSLPTAANWALRETFISVIVVTAPGIKPLFSRSRWIKGSSDENSQPKSGLHYASHSRSAHAANVTGGYADDTKKDPYELSSSVGWMKGSKNKGMIPLDGASTSQEHIVLGKDEERAIHVTTEYRLEHEHSDASSVEQKAKTR